METKCCIVGGGIAGLKAAHMLLTDPRSKFEVEDVMILEAQNRIGGRVFTDKTLSKLGYNYDLGGSWFHDSLTNINLREVIENGSFDVMKDGYYDDKDMVYFDKDTSGPIAVDDHKIHRVIEELMKFIELYYHQSVGQEDMSILDIVDVYIKQHGNRLTDIQKKYAKKMVRFFELWFGLSSDVCSAKYTLLDHEGRDLFNLKGNQMLIDQLLKDIPESQIHLNTQVSKIIQNNRDNQKKICLETNKGKVYADYLVLTVPLSILKLPATHEYGITWEPELPKFIINALNNSSFGALGKVIFEFDDVWWDNNMERIVYLDEGTSDNLSQPIEHLPGTVNYPYLIMNYKAMINDGTKSGSFIILTQAPLTQYLEAHPDKAWDYFKKSFEKVKLPHKQVCEPINVITTNWTQNPYIRGLYSAIEVGGSFEEMIVQLSGQIDGAGLSYSTIRFAGEHTVVDGNGCIHGAYSSGIREAEWIINHST